MVPSDEPTGQRGVINVRLVRLVPLLLFGLAQLLDADPRFRVAGLDDQWRPGGAAALHVVVSGLSPVSAELLSTSGSPSVPTLIVARAAEPSEVIEAGASGFVPEDAALTTILEAIQQVAEGGRFMVDPPAADRKAPADVLSPRERQVLTWIAQGRTHYQVARILGISAHTVDTYVKRAKSKLRLGNKADLTRAVLSGQGH